jgi:hypothetical protein
VGAGSYHQAVPMYNPLQYPPAPTSVPSTWKEDQHESRDPFHLHTSNSWNVIKSDLPSLAPAFIPDCGYQDYLRTGRRRAINQKKGAIPLSKVCCAKVCAMFSFVAVGFLLFVGIIFDKQPLYIPGALPKHLQYVEGSTSRTQVFYSITPSARLLQASNAYGAAFIYLITGCFSVLYAYDLMSCYRRKSYQEIPDANSTAPTFHQPNWSASKDYTLPMTTSPNRRPYYPRGGIPDSYMETLRFHYNRARIYVASVWPENDHRRTRKRKADPKEV